MRCVSPWYNRTGWLGVKHQLSYLLFFFFNPLTRSPKLSSLRPLFLCYSFVPLIFTSCNVHYITSISLHVIVMPTFFPNPGHNNSRIKQLNRKQSILHLIVHRLTLASVFCSLKKKERERKKRENHFTAKSLRRLFQGISPENNFNFFKEINIFGNI